MKKFLKIVFGIIAALFVLGMLLKGFDRQVASDMQKIENQVAADAVKQYNIAAKHGSDMDAYVAAGMAKAAFLQAKDEANYHKWDSIESVWGKKVGL